ncbi:MAG TPA: response regulator transcription factor [Patescibacteria group bacterium]
MPAVITLIEDDHDISEYLQNILAEEGYEVYSEDSGSKGLKLIEKVGPDLVLLDLHLPDIPGETICKQIRKEYPAMKVIMITAKDTPEDLARGLNLGADDYIAKPVAPEELLARVQARLRTGGGDNKKLVLGDLEMDLSGHEVYRGDKELHLSPQEFKLLEYLMQNPNRVLTREMILSRIWGGSPDIETRVVDVYIGYLRKKVDKGFKPQLIHSVRGFGYMLKEE